MTGNAARLLDHLAYGKTLSAAEVEGGAFAAAQQVFERKNMRLRQIAHMDVVADTGAVGRWVVRAEHRDLAALSVCDLQDQRNEVGFGEMRFAERTVRMRAAGIEIPQRGVPQAGRGRRPAHHALHDALGLAVAVSRIESGSFLNGNLFGFAVDRCGGGKNDRSDVMCSHLLEQYARAADVVVIVAQRQFAALADLRERCKMNYAVDVLLFEQAGEKGCIANVALIKSAGRRYGCAEAGAEVVGHDHMIAGLEHCPHCVRADIACAAGH